MKWTTPLLIARVLKAQANSAGELTLQELKSRLVRLAEETVASTSTTTTTLQHKGKRTSKDFFVPNSSKSARDGNGLLLSSSVNQNGPSLGSSTTSTPHKASSKKIKKPKRRNRVKKDEDFAPISWTNGFASSQNYRPKARTSYQAKSEFDTMIKDWITTNWLNVDQVQMQKKPCHFLIHDRMAYHGLSVFEAVVKNLEDEFPDINLSRRELRQRWNDEFSTMTLLNNENTSKIVSKKFLELVKTVFWPAFKTQRQDAASLLFKQYLNDPQYEQNVIATLKRSVSINARMVNYLKNFENLNINNNFTYIKDRELSLLPSLDYSQLIWDARKKNRVFKKFSLLKYTYVFGNKVNDFKNLDKLKSIMNDIPSQENPYFIVLTADKETSLEYYRLLKLAKQAHVGDEEKRGCVVFLNEITGNSTTTSFFPPDNKTRNYAAQTYNVIDHFSEIYDILEAL
ncbi:hypothetical protein FOA43_002285 [Brettanomyces nanus]|uniref:Uncharacterized protein n=1 Tax=Eeniella nana TaxID=13502 RepID=A0A875RUT7_EENNA|nr:uncharacterized protein FOA43_002285 [Brettanomyces nanus]QPG74947.1 hypothetical protein FOA43_002285 [Brettanomyces nanus]